MRFTAAIALFLLALCAPASAVAGTFAVPFGGGTPMLAAGWTPRPDAGAVCAYEGTGTVFLNAGTLAAHSGCLYLFNAPAAAQILAVNVSLAYAKASTASALCAYSFGALPGDTMRRCSGRVVHERHRRERRQLGGARSLQRGRHADCARNVASEQRRLHEWLGHAQRSDRSGARRQRPDRDSDRALRGAELGGGRSARAARPRFPTRSTGAARWGFVARRARGSAAQPSAAARRSTWARWQTGPIRSRSTRSRTPTPAPAWARWPSRVDRTAPTQPGIRVEPDAAAPATGWWGHGPIALTVSSPTANDVAASTVRVYGPSGALAFQASSAGAVTHASVPASAFAAVGAYEVDVTECDAAGHCTASPRAGLHWDAAPPRAAADGFAPPLGAIAARDGAHLSWPASAAPRARAASPAGFSASAATPASARAQALAASAWEAGVPGVSEAAVPAALIRGGERVCLAVRLLSGAGIALGVGRRALCRRRRAAARDRLGGGVPWSGGAQTLALAAGDASGAAFSQVLLDGAVAATTGGSITISGEGAHVLRVVARDGAGNETVVERTLGVDASPPVIGARRDRLRGARGARRRRGRAVGRRPRRGAPRRHCARDPARGRRAHRGRARARGLRAGRRRSDRARPDASSPAQRCELSASLPVRPLPVAAGLSVVARPRDRPGRRRRAGAACGSGRIRRAARRGSSAPTPTRAGGTFAVRVRPRRTTRYAVAVPESQQLRGLAERVAGTRARDRAHRRRCTLRVRGDRLRRPRPLRRPRRGHAPAPARARRARRALGRGLPRARPARACASSATGRVWGTCSDPAERPRPRLDLPPRAGRALEHLAVAHAVERVARACSCPL